MNNLLNEYLRFNFELNIELNHFLARFKVKMNDQNLSATPNCVRSGMVTATMTILQTMFPSSQAETFYISLASGAPPLWPPLSVFAPISHLALLFAPTTDCQEAKCIIYVLCHKAKG